MRRSSLFLPYDSSRSTPAACSCSHPSLGTMVEVESLNSSLVGLTVHAPVFSSLAISVFAYW